MNIDGMRAAVDGMHQALDAYLKEEAETSAATALLKAVLLLVGEVTIDIKRIADSLDQSQK